MQPIRIACDGAQIGPLRLPPFQLKTGEAVTLLLPRPFPEHAQEHLLQALTRAGSVPGIQHFGRVEWAAPAVAPRGWLALWRQGRLTQPRPVDWLRANANLSGAEADTVVGRLGLNPRWRLSELAMNPRTLLGLEAAWARGAEVVVFQTSGCDPAGVREVFAAVASRLQKCSAIYLSHGFWSQDQFQRDCLPGASCIEVSIPDPKAVASGQGRE
jgi:hypothetical protein